MELKILKAVDGFLQVSLVLCILLAVGKFFGFIPHVYISTNDPKTGDQTTPYKYSLNELATLQKGDFLQTGTCGNDDCDGQLLMVYSVRCQTDNLAECRLEVMGSPYLQKNPAMPLEYWLPKVGLITRHQDFHWSYLAHKFLTQDI